MALGPEASAASQTSARRLTSVRTMHPSKQSVSSTGPVPTRWNCVALRTCLWQVLRDQQRRFDLRLSGTRRPNLRRARCAAIDWSSLKWQESSIKSTSSCRQPKMSKSSLLRLQLTRVSATWRRILRSANRLQLHGLTRSSS